MTEPKALTTPVLITGDGGDYLKISAIGRSHPTATDYSDGNWVDCSIDFRSGGFTGKIGGSLRTDELESFSKDLALTYEDLRTPASFANLDGHLFIEISGDGLGHLTAACTVAQSAAGGPQVNFELHFDQTELPRIQAQLSGILEAFPVVGDPPELGGALLQERIADGDPYLRDVYLRVRRSIWGPIGVMVISFQLVYLLLRGSIPAIESGILAPIVILLGFALRRWRMGQLDPSSRTVYLEWIRHERDRRWWPSIMAVIGGWVLLFSALFSREEATSEVGVNAIAASGAILSVIGLFQLGRRLLR